MHRRIWDKYKVIFVILISVIIATLIILLMDYSLLKSIFSIYYGESNVVEYFKEQGQNLFKNSIRVTAFKLILFRAFYSMIPLAIMLFLFIYYHEKQLPGFLRKHKVFEKNKDLPKILQIGRYGLAIGIFYLILTFQKDYYYSTFHNCLLGYVPDFLRIILACLAFLVLTCDLKRFAVDLWTFPKRHRYLTIFAFILLISVLSFVIMEFQIGSKTQVFVYLIHTNIMYWLLLQLIILGLTRRPKIGAITSLTLAFAIGLANDIVYQFRGNYIMFGDLTVVRTAMEVAGNYDYKPGFWFWISLSIFLVSVLFVIFIKLPTKRYLLKVQKRKQPAMTEEVDGEKMKDPEGAEGTKPSESIDGEKPVEQDPIADKAESSIAAFDMEVSDKRKLSRGKRILLRIGTTILIEAALVLFIVLTFRSGSFYGYVFGVGWDYNDNVTAVGYLPYFFSNMDSTVRVEVEDYSPEKAKEELEQGSNQYKEAHQTTEEVKSPNIIIVQNEAFADLRILADIETDVDTMPYIHSLSENVQKGYMNMSVTGGPTSNTEFEVLTRSSLQYLPYGAVPYTQYLKHNTPSLARMLSAQENPYKTVAYHSYYASGYNRNSVYDYLGFDQKEFEEHFLDEYPESDLPRGYMSDEANYRKVIQLYEANKSSGSPFFCFNVTIQGHGGYTGGPYDLSEKVDVTNFTPTESIRTYLSSVKMSDTAFKGLIEYFEKVEEPTIIFMYGDHQPSFDDEAKELLTQHPAWEDTDLQFVSPYYVPYVIWANYDIEERDGLIPWGVKAAETEKWDFSGLNRLSTNYAGSYILNLAGVELSAYDRYLLNLHETVPAITAIGVWMEDGIGYVSAPQSPEAEKLHEMEMIQYNLIFDPENMLTEYFMPGDG